jgi:hypothetical protein
MKPQVELELEPGSSRFDPSDERWLRQVADFAQELDHAVGEVSRHDTPMIGKKGTAEQIILSLGSAGAFTASVEFIKAWLGRDRGRRLRIKWFENGKLQSLELSGENLDDAAFDRIKSLARGKNELS